MKFFSVDGALYRFFSRLWDMVKLNLLWLLFSLPIVTMGAATVAAYSVTLKMVDEQEGYIGRQFLDAFRKNLKQGIPLGLLFLASLYIIYLDTQLFQAVEENTLFLVFGIIAGFVFILIFIYAFPLSARYENTLVRTLKNSMDISVRYFLRTVFLAALLCLELVIIYWNQTTLIIGVLMGPACIMLTISGFAMKCFREIEKEPGSVTDSHKD